MCFELIGAKLQEKRFFSKGDDVPLTKCVTVISQQLIPTADGSGRVAAFEVLHSNPAVRNLIREGKTHQLTSVMQTNRKAGMMTMDDALLQLYTDYKIDRNMALQFAQDPESMKMKLI